MKCTSIAAVIAGVFAARGVAAQKLPALLPEGFEIALARSAAPAALSEHADIYVLQRGGHVKVRSGSNGAACLVARDHPESLYPICYDPEAARSILLVEIEQQRLRERGWPDDSVTAWTKRAFATGVLEPPAGRAIAYMMSRHQIIYAGATGRRVGSWFPHLMIYLPHMTRAQLAMPGLPNGDLTLGDEGEPTAHYVVMTRDWAEAPPLPALAPTLAAQPGWLCTGDSYLLRWSGPDGARLQRAEGVRESRQPLRDGLTFSARENTVLRALSATDSLISTDTVSIHPERMEHNFVRPGAACAGRLSVASMAIPPLQASDRITPRSVTNHGADAIVITHRGITVRLAPGESTERFNALPFSGDWGVVVETGDYNRFCPLPSNLSTAAAPAPRVDVLIVTTCAG